MTDAFKNLLIGLFITTFVVALIIILMFLHPNIGNKGKLLHVYFTDVDKITEGTRVTYAGRPVGKVVNIEKTEAGRNGRTDSSGRIYLYNLTLQVDSGVNVYNTDKIAPKTSGLLGEKNIEITPYASPPGEKLLLLDNTVIYAIETDSIENTLHAVNSISEKFKSTLDSITGILKEVHDELLVEKVTTAVVQFIKVVEDMDTVTNDVHHTWPAIEKTINDIDLMAKQFGMTAQHAGHSLDLVDSMLTQASHVIAQVAKGEGSLGKLMVNDDFYLRMTSIMSKAETTMDDINHYGILFHSDKRWQRLRARRLNLLQKLQSPQEFRNYFNDEINQISTSLSRVYMVLNEFSQDTCGGYLLDDQEYNKVFSELMRRVGMLEEEIKMYNAQVVEAKISSD